MKKERFKRRIRKITAFAAAVAMTASITFSGGTFGGFGLTASAATVGAFEVTGGTLDTDYTYAEGLLTVIRNGANLTIKNTDPSVRTEDHILIADGVSANITLAGVNVYCNTASSFKIYENSTGNVTVTLKDDSINNLYCSEQAAIDKSGDSEGIGTLTIQCEKSNLSGHICDEHCGKLEASGSNASACIGGRRGISVKNLKINGGNIVAYRRSQEFGAAIGGGYEGSASDITINGGNITVTGYSGAAIGGGDYGSASNITINGGNISAKTTSFGAAIGSGDGGTAKNIRINGGTVYAEGVRGSGIGAGYVGTAEGIYITGGNITAKSSGLGSSGIGGRNVSDIEISGGIVFAESTSGAAIGTNFGDSTASNIKITGDAIVTAHSQSSAGIGRYGECNNLTTNFVITARSVKSISDAAVTDTTPTNGSGTDVYLLKTDPNQNNENVYVDGVLYPIKKHSDSDDHLYLYLPIGMNHTVQIGESGVVKEYKPNDTVKKFVKTIPDPLLKVTSTDSSSAPVQGSDYRYEGSELHITSPKKMTIENIDKSEPSTDYIVIDSGIAADITLAGVNIKPESSGYPSIMIADNSPANVKITLADNTVNTLVGSYGAAALQKVGDESSGTLTITCQHSEETDHICNDSCGKLSATGFTQSSGDYDGTAGIGGNNKDGAGTANITISGGNITAVSDAGAGIGGGSSKNSYPVNFCKNITISGGNITATGVSGAGIGSGQYGYAKNINIIGGNINATSRNGAGIGSGRYYNSTLSDNINISGGIVKASKIGNAGYAGKTANITISGGTVSTSSGIAADSSVKITGGSVKSSINLTPTDGSGNVYLLKISNSGGKAVYIDDAPYSPVNHSALGDSYYLYAYLNGDSQHSVKVGNNFTRYEYDSANSKWIIIFNITAPVAIDDFVYDGVEHELVTAGTTDTGTMQYSTSETGAYSTDIPKGKDAGDYSVWFRVVDDSGNVIAAPAKVGDITIETRAVNISADDMSKTFGESDPTLEYTVDSATPLAEGEILTGALERATGEDVGTYDITQGTLTNVNNPNYDITFNKGTFTISGAEINEIVITDITAPVPKDTLDTSAQNSTTGCSISAVSWTDGDTTAKFDKAYTAKVVVTADSNHSFGSSLTAKVNGETASVTKNADGTVTVTYTFAKTAAAAVTKIEMKTSPTKTEYFVGEDIDLTGATIIATYEDSTTSEPIPITAEMISGFDSSTAGTKTVTVEYESKTTTFNVTIKEPAVTGITISTTPKTEYLIGDSLDVTGGEITISYEYGDDKVIAITSGMVTGFDSRVAVESQTLTVTYEEKTDTYTITVKKHTPTVTAPTASAITLGQTLADSTLSDSTWSWEDSSIQPTSAGTHSYTAVKNVSDADKYDYTALDGFTFNSSTNTLSTSVSVVVNRVGASVTSPTASNTLTYGQALSAAGLTEGWTWENASTIPDVNNTGYTAYKIVTDYDNFDYSNLTGFDYDETTNKLSCKVSVTVSPTAPTDATTASQSFTTGTASTAFAAPVFKGIDGAELTGSVSYTYGGQTYATTAALTAVLDNLAGETTGTISYTFTPDSANYTTASGSITFSVIDAVVTGITLKSAPTKTTYEVGDTLDLTGGKITVSYNNNTSVDIDITDAMTSGFDSTTAGEKTVTVTYGGFTTSFKVTVSKGSFTVEPTPGNMDGAEIDMPEDELNDAVLTPEDKELIEQGVDIAVLMTVITINPETVPVNDVTAIDNVMGDFELGCYIDVELFKRYSNGNPDVPVTDTNAPITISFKVPADILAQYPVSDYEYSVFCSHNGVGYPITCSYNATTNVMSFSSTMFSTYALAVKSRTPVTVDYTITADSHVTVQSTAQAGDIVSVTVEDGYKATVTNSLGTVITTITGTGSFVMPESNVTITSELINTHVHNYSTEWNMDSTSHWHECACGDKVNVAAHVSNGGIVTVRPTETTEGVRTYSCSICGYVMSTETIPMLDPDHSHNYGTQWKSDSTSHWHECDCGEKADIASHISDNGVVTLQPTETSEGIMTYSCSICGYILRTETIPANTPVHTHNYGTAWYYDSIYHWHECSCGDRSNIGQHISNGGIVTVQPTAYTTGVRTYSCSVCGYVLRTETIPATGYNYPSYPTYPTYPTYPFDSSIFNVVTFTDKVNVTAETEGNTVTIKWDKVEKADKYYVYQYKNGKYVKVKTTSDTSATFKKLKNGETYKFLIRYTKSGRLSPTKYSGTISVKIYYKPIPKPTATKNSIKLTWEAIPEAEKYAVYKYVDGKAIKLTETKKLSVKIGKLIPDTEYKYIVRAYVDGKWTTMLKSDIVTVKTKAE